MRMFPILEELPDNYAVGVGLVIARWAYQEWLFVKVLRAILGTGAKEARYIFGTAEGTDYVSLIGTLIELRGLKTDVDLKDLKRRFWRVREERNIVAHGLWLKDGAGTPRIQVITGQWRPMPDEPEVSRKLKPEAVAFSRQDANALIAQINEMIDLTKRLLKDLGPQLPKVDARELDTMSASVGDTVTGFGTTTAGGLREGSSGRSGV